MFIVVSNGTAAPHLEEVGGPGAGGVEGLVCGVDIVDDERQQQAVTSIPCAVLGLEARQPGTEVDDVRPTVRVGQRDEPVGLHGDGVTDVRDFNVWNQHRDPTELALSVPEPAAWVLAVLGLLAFGLRRPNRETNL